MIAASVIFVTSYVVIASGRLPLAVVAMVGASVMVLLRVLDGHEALEHIDLNVILLLGGMMTLAEVIGRTDAFDWIAIRSARLVKGSGFGLICLLSLFTAVASAFLDNVTTVVLMVPITLALCRSLKLDPVPFLLAEVFASNIGGTATLVGDPPNIIIASEADIGFLEFMLNVAPVTLISMVPLFGLTYLWLRKEVEVESTLRRQIVQRQTADTIKDRPLLTKSSVSHVLFILLAKACKQQPFFVARDGRKCGLEKNWSSGSRSIRRRRLCLSAELGAELCDNLCSYGGSHVSRQDAQCHFEPVQGSQWDQVERGQKQVPTVIRLAMR